MADIVKLYQNTTDGIVEQIIQTTAEAVVVDGYEIGFDSSVTNVKTALQRIKSAADSGGVTGVKGSAESTYRTGQVNITAANIGLGNVDNTSDATKPVSSPQAAAIKVVQDDINTHEANTSNPHSVTKAQVGLGNVTNEAQVPLSQKGAASGVAPLDANKRIPTEYLPSYVDDVVEGTYTDGATSPVGESGKIYVDTFTNKTFRWSGSKYVEISSSLALGSTSSTAYRGDLGAQNSSDISTLQGLMSTAQNNISTLQTAEGQNVKLTGDQTINGNKQFNNLSVQNELVIKKSGSTIEATLDINNVTSNVTVSLPNTSGTLAVDAVATTSNKGLMSSDMVTKLNGIASGATANTGTVTSVTIKGGTGILVDNTTAITTSGSRTISLSDSGVVAGTYSAVAVDAKGRVTAGNQLVEWGTDGQTTPSANLAIGGLFFMKV